MGGEDLRVKGDLNTNSDLTDHGTVLQHLTSVSRAGDSNRVHQPS